MDIPLVTPSTAVASSKRPYRGREAFTLIELLVVISIVALLAALASTGLMRALDRAKLAKSSGNLRQIGVALLAYAGENDMRFPTAGGTIPYGPITDPNPAWSVQLEPYAGTDRSLYKNPTASKKDGQERECGFFLGTRAALAAGGAIPAPVYLNRMGSPSRHILGGEVRAYDFDQDDVDPDDYVQDPAFGGGTQATPVNILFADGHVAQAKAFNKDDMTTRYDGPGFDYLE